MAHCNQMDPKYFSKYIKKLAEVFREESEKLSASELTFHSTTDQIRSLNELFALTLDESRTSLNPNYFWTRRCEKKTDDFKKELSDLMFIYKLIQKISKLEVGELLANHKTSNDQFKVDIASFESLTAIKIQRVPIERIVGLEKIRSLLQEIKAERCLTSVNDILGRCGGDNSERNFWNALTRADFSYNGLEMIDNSFEFTPRLQSLNLSHNRLNHLSALVWCRNLKELNLSFNYLTAIPNFNKASHHKLQSLIIHDNLIEDISTLEELKTLTSLDLSNNCLLDFTQLQPLCASRALCYLKVCGNPITSTPEPIYRLDICRNLSETVISTFQLDGKQLSKYERAVVRKCYPSSGRSNSLQVETPTKNVIKTEDERSAKLQTNRNQASTAVSKQQTVEIDTIEGVADPRPVKSEHSKNPVVKTRQENLIRSSLLANNIPTNNAASTSKNSESRPPMKLETNLIRNKCNESEQLGTAESVSAATSVNVEYIESSVFVRSTHSTKSATLPTLTMILQSRFDKSQEKFRPQAQGNCREHSKTARELISFKSKPASPEREIIRRTTPFNSSLVFTNSTQTQRSVMGGASSRKPANVEPAKILAQQRYQTRSQVRPFNSSTIYRKAQMSSISDDSDYDKPPTAKQSSLFSTLTNAVQVNFVKTEIKGKSLDAKKKIKKVPKAATSDSDESQPERKFNLQAWSSSIRDKVIRLRLLSPDILMRSVGWSVSYRDEEVSASASVDEDWGEGKSIEFSIAAVDLHVFYATFALKCEYELGDDKENVYTGFFTVELQFFINHERFEFSYMDQYRADPDLVAIFRNDYKMDDTLSLTQKHLLQDIHDYCRTPIESRPYNTTVDMLENAQSFEDLEFHRKLLDLEMSDVEIFVFDYEANAQARVHSRNQNFKCGMAIPKEYAKRLKSLPFDEIIVVISYTMHPRSRDGEITTKDITVTGNIESVKTQELILTTRFNFRCETYTSKLVFFEFNRASTKASLKALDNVAKSHDLMKFLRNSDLAQAYMGAPMMFDKIFRDEDFKWSNPQLNNNVEQQIAIKNVVNCSSFPLPYVIFGPPGTGKTSALVECVVQISKLRPEARILITAQSNSACEEIGTRLLKAVSINEILRLYSNGIDKDKLERMDQRLRASSNKRKNAEQWPSKQEFNFFKIVIVTLMTSSRMVQSDITKGHFNYIFLDECAAASEPESLVPIIGLGTNAGQVTANIVILGDHKQLGANVKSDMAESMGLGISLMERIMTTAQYKAGMNGYDSNYITQLLDNYRCHPAVLQFSNVVFYNNILRAEVNDYLRNFAENWQLLSNKQFPVLLHCVRSPSQVVEKGTSSFNDKEIEIVKFYVDHLTKHGIGGKAVANEDIGIVTPYIAQLRKLRGVIKSIEIGTAEYFQGREKKIIIISTVRSCTNVGFLKSEKRLNVILTRAQSLMIVVGNAETLQRDRLWRTFVHYCFYNNACVGANFGLVSLVAEDEKLVEQMCEVFKKKEKVPNKDEQEKVIEDMRNRLANLRNLFGSSSG